MERKRGLLQTVSVRFVVYAALGVLLLHVLTSPFFIDPLIAFLLAGIVPGTDIALAPETILIIILDLFGLTIVLLLVGWLLQRRATEGTDPMSAARKTDRLIHGIPAVKMPRRVARNVTTRAVDTAASSAVQLAAARFLDAVWYVAAYIWRVPYFVIGIVFIVLRFVLELIVEGTVQVIGLLLAGLKKAGAGFVWCFVFFIALLGTLIDMSLRAGRRGWVLVRPHLETFDAWLEIQYRKIESDLQRRAKRSETMQVVSAVAKDSAASIRRLFGK